MVQIKKSIIVTLLIVINVISILTIVNYYYKEDITYMVTKEHENVLPYAYTNLVNAHMITCYKSMETVNETTYVLNVEENTNINKSCINQYKLVVRHANINVHFEANNAKLLLKKSDNYYEVLKNNAISSYNLNQ